MKRLFLFFMILCSSNYFLLGQILQNQQTSQNIEMPLLKNGDPNDFFTQNIEFPEELLVNIENYNIILSFVIEKTGKIDSITLIKNTNQNATREALSALNKSNGLWTPAKINGVSVNRKFLASFNFVTTSNYTDSKKKVQKFIKKGNYDLALQMINEALKFNEYDKELYQLRSSIYKKQNQTELENYDLQKIDFINNNLLIDLWVFAVRK